MPRTEIALALIVIMAVSIATAAIMTLRYRHYKRRVSRGSRNVKPVWKPFWMH